MVIGGASFLRLLYSLTQFLYCNTDTSCQRIPCVPVERDLELLGGACVLAIGDQTPPDGSPSTRKCVRPTKPWKGEVVFSF